MPKEYNDAIAYAIENTIHMYTTIERDLFIENFDLDYNLQHFHAYVMKHEQDIYYYIVLLAHKTHKDELRSIYNELHP